ncbi:hypothetical protein ACHWQZ_G001178 [Mnemiopsis leidyi]
MPWNIREKYRTLTGKTDITPADLGEHPLESLALAKTTLVSHWAPIATRRRRQQPEIRRKDGSKNEGIMIHQIDVCTHCKRDAVATKSGS